MAAVTDQFVRKGKRVTFQDENNQYIQPNVTASRIPVRSNAISDTNCTSKTGAIKKCPKKQQVRKTFVRNVDQPVLACTNKRSVQHTSVHSLYSTTNKKSNVLKEPTNKFSAPELHTTLSLANEIRKTSLNVPKTRITTTKDLPPVKCQIAEEKIARKLNFPLEEQLYRDLIELNVRDEDIIPAERPVPRVWRKLPKDKEPQLPDFFSPTFGPEYCSIPKVTVKPVAKVRHFDGLSLFRRQQLWRMSKPEDR